MGTPALIRPSSADLSVNCLGSRRAARLYPQGDTQATIEGTQAHEVVKHFLLTGEMLETLPDGTPVTEEMAEGAELAFSLIDTWIGHDFELLAALHVEEWLDISHIHPDNAGTPDYWLYDSKRGILYIADYKFGRVEVKPDCWQLKNYYAGIYNKLGFDGAIDQLITVKFFIIQPRFYRGAKIRSHECMASDLRGYINWMTLRFHEGDKLDAPFTSGDWCLYCPAAAHCDTHHMAAQAGIDRSELIPLRELSPVELDHELTELEKSRERIDSRIKALRAEGEHMLRNGKLLPNYGMINTYGRLTWTIPTDEVISLGDLEGVDLRKPETPITPTQAKAKKMPLEYIDLYAEKPKRGLVMVRLDQDYANDFN